MQRAVSGCAVLSFVILSNTVHADEASDAASPDTVERLTVELEGGVTPRNDVSAGVATDVNQLVTESVTFEIRGGLYYASGGSGPVAYDLEFGIGDALVRHSTILEPIIGLGVSFLGVISAYARLGTFIYVPVSDGLTIVDLEYLHPVIESPKGIRAALRWFPHTKGFFLGVRTESYFGDNASGIAASGVLGMRFM
ncbi:MAG: hypothetical protein ABI467_05410 [Kofleriaceae bacterium]